MKKKGIFILLVVICLLALSAPALAASTSSVEVIPIYRAADTYDWTHSYYTNTTSYLAYLNTDPGTNISDGFAGYLSPVPLPGLVPLYAMRYSMDIYLAAGDDVRDALIMKYGYYDTGMLGYVAPATSTSLGNRNMYVWFRPGSDNHSYNDQDHYFHDTAKYIGTYFYEGTAFRVWNDNTVLQKIDLIAPTPGPTLNAGDVVQIKWTSQLSEGSVNLLYSKNGAAGPWIIIKEGLSANLGSYSWTVPNINNSNVALKAEWTYSNQYGSTYLDDISAPFTIKGTISPIPGLIITTPIFQKVIPSAPTNLTTAGDFIAQKVTLFWQDNATSESGYVIERKAAGGSYAQLTQTAANVSTYIDTTAQVNLKYTYRVKAKGILSDSAYSNEAIGGYSLIKFEIPNFELIIPQVPQNLTATLTSADAIELSWQAVSGSISGYKIERMIEPSGAWEIVGSVSSSKTSYTDTGLDTETAYTYRVRSYDAVLSSNPSNEVSLTTMAEGEEPASGDDSGGSGGTTGDNTMVFHMGALAYSVNGAPQNMDVGPASIGGRTFLPIRFVTTPMGAGMIWDAVAKKVTISQGSIIIELWINNPVAKVNGVDTPIDSANSSVMPVALSGRTLLPLRFIAEQLGCSVVWDPLTKSVSITY